MAGLKGLTGLYADPQDTTDFFDEGVLEAKANPLHPDHSTTGVQAYGYSGPVPSEPTPFGPLAVYDGWSPEDTAQFGGIGFDYPGDAIEQTPVTHSAPYPRGIIQQSWDNPDGLATAGQQIAILHADDFGGPRFYLGNSPAGHEEVTHYTTNRYDAPNDTYQVAIPEQLKGASIGGQASKDTTQGYGELNTVAEFQRGHSIRREQHDRMPWDFTNTHGEQNVPFYGRHPVGQMSLDGPDSPYFAMGDISGANTPWEGRIAYPTPYQQPAEPTIIEANPGSDVWAWS